MKDIKGHIQHKMLCVMIRWSARNNLEEREEVQENDNHKGKKIVEIWSRAMRFHRNLWSVMFPSTLLSVSIIVFMCLFFFLYLNGTCTQREDKCLHLSPPRPASCAVHVYVHACVSIMFMLYKSIQDILVNWACIKNVGWLLFCT